MKAELIPTAWTYGDYEIECDADSSKFEIYSTAQEAWINGGWPVRSLAAAVRLCDEHKAAGDTAVVPVAAAVRTEELICEARR